MKSKLATHVWASLFKRSTQLSHYNLRIIGPISITFLTLSMPHCIVAQTSLGTLIAANQADADISIVDLKTAKEVARVPEGAAAGHEVATSLDGKIAYVPIYGDAYLGAAGTDGRELLAIELVSHKIVGRLDLAMVSVHTASR